MRLGTCIALELVVAVGTVGGACVGVMRAAELATAYLGTPEASAATEDAIAHAARANSAPSTASLITALPSSELRVALTVTPSVFGAPDAELLAPLGAAKVTRVKWNLGGTSISLRLDFANGARAAFKPEQIHLQSDPRREIAAYRLDRLLELRRVPPAKPGSIPFAEIIAAIDPSVRQQVAARLVEEATVRDGMLHGELSWWVPEIKQAHLGKHPVDEREGRALWTSYLQVGATIPAAVRSLVEQIAACVLFDVLVDNADRWSGNNTVMSPDGKVFYIMDNTMSFSLARIGHEMNVGILHRIQVFPRELVRRMRALTEARLARVLEADGESNGKLGRLLSPQEIHAVLERRDNIMKYVDGLIAAHGEEAVLALP